MVRLAGLLLAGSVRCAVLCGIAWFLVVEDHLQPPAAIVALGGQTPFREIEAAKLYHAGRAPRVVIVREAPNSEVLALEELGISVSGAWELSRAVLVKEGVPADAILVPQHEGIGTLEELQAAYRALGSKNAPVILVTSKFHPRRTRLTWQYVTNNRSPAVVRAASRDPFDPEHWWQKRQSALFVAREYLGLVNYYAGFPVVQAVSCPKEARLRKNCLVS